MRTTPRIWRPAPPAAAHSYTDRAPSAPRNLGSSRSRSASPNMFKLYTTSVRLRPGQSASRGSASMYWRPSRLSIPPQSGMSGGRPKPRKLSDAALRM